MARAAAGLDPEVLPDVELVRYIHPDEDFEITAACMSEQGWEAEEDQGLSFYIPPGQEEAFDVAMYVCVAKYPKDPKYTVPLSDERLEAVYEFRIAETLPCVRQHGYTVPDAPTLATFLAQKGKWDPAADAERQVAEDPAQWDSYNEFSEACPSGPTVDELYDD